MTAFKHNPKTKGQARAAIPADIEHVSIGGIPDVPGFDKETFFSLTLGVLNVQSRKKESLCFAFSIEDMNSLRDTIELLIQKYPELLRTKP